MAGLQAERRSFIIGPASTGRLADSARAAALSMGVLALGLALWQAASGRLSYAGGGLPGPWETVRSAWELVSSPFYDFGPNDKGIGWQLVYSMRRLLSAYLGTALAAVAVGTALGLNPVLWKALNPYIQVFKTVSPLAWMPLFLYTVRESERAVFLVVFISTLWPILTNTAFGVSSIDREYLHVAAILELPWHRRLLRVVLPAAAPSILVGLRVAVGTAWVALVAAEMLVGGNGLGYFIWNEWNNLKLTSVLTGILVIGLVGYALDAALAAAQRAVRYSR